MCCWRHQGTTSLRCMQVTAYSWRHIARSSKKCTVRYCQQTIRQRPIPLLLEQFMRSIGHSPPSSGVPPHRVIRGTGDIKDPSATIIGAFITIPFLAVPFPSNQVILLPFRSPSFLGLRCVVGRALKPASDLLLWVV